MYFWDQVSAVIKALDEQGDDLNASNVETKVDAAITSITEDPQRAISLRNVVEKLLVL